ncbi:MAG: polysaccharide deacetylase family protein [Actinomycetota bacterium]|nr:polysaccharide deacetylase family protein [Actinomycetota bacterium]
MTARNNSPGRSRPVPAWRAVTVAVGLALLTLPVLGPVSPAEGLANTVVSLTFDDNLTSQYDNRLELSSRGLKGTFYVNSDLLGTSPPYYATAAQMKEVQNLGNEIGGHGLGHQPLAPMPAEEQRRRVCDDRKALQDLGFGLATSFAYPFVSFNDVTKSIVKECGYNSGRKVGGIKSGAACPACPVGESIPPRDAYETRTPRGVEPTDTAATLQEYVTQAENGAGGWVQLVFHDICPATCPTDPEAPDYRANGISRGEFVAFLEWLKGRPEATRGTTTIKTVGEVIGGAVRPVPTTTTTTPGGGTGGGGTGGGGTGGGGTGGGTAANPGYVLVASDGGIFAFGGARFLGSTGAIKLNKPIVGMAYTPSGAGYRLVASDGGIFAFGDAPFFGSTGATKLNQPIVGMATTPSGNGYWLVASDGGIFAFGDAVFRGSTGALKLNKPIVGMAPTPTGNGYWLVASDGGIFAFGDAVFRGSTGALKLNLPVVGMASTPGGNGYWLVASDGGIFAFGDAVFRGSTGALKLNKPINGMTPTLTGNGYWLVASDGGIFAFGDARFFGSTGDIKLNQPVVGMAAPPR